MFPHIHKKPAYWELTFNNFHQGCTMHLGAKTVITSFGEVKHKDFEDGEATGEKTWEYPKERSDEILNLFEKHRAAMSERDDTIRQAGLGHTDLYIKMEIQGHHEQKFSSNYATLESLEAFETAVLKLVDTVEMFDLEE